MCYSPLTNISKEGKLYHEKETCPGCGEREMPSRILIGGTKSVAFVRHAVNSVNPK